MKASFSTLPHSMTCRVVAAVAAALCGTAAVLLGVTVGGGSSSGEPPATGGPAPPWLPRDLPDVLPRAGQYMTFSTREDDAVLAGLAWTGLGADGMVRMHAVHQHRLQAWGWRRHDGRGFGEHFVGDALNRVNLTMGFLRHDDGGAGGDAAAPWTARLPPGCRPWSALIDGADSGPPDDIFFPAPGHIQKTRHEEVPSGAAPAGSPVSLFSFLSAATGTVTVEPARVDDAAGTSLTVLRGRRPRPGGGGGTQDFALLVWARRGGPRAAGAGRSQHYNRSSSAGAGDASLDVPHVTAYSMPAEHVWRVDNIVAHELGEGARLAEAAAAGDKAAAALPVIAVLSDAAHGDAATTLALVQSVLVPPFELEWLFLNDEACWEASMTGSDGGAAAQVELGPDGLPANPALTGGVDWPDAVARLGFRPRTPFPGAPPAGAVAAPSGPAASVVDALALRRWRCDAELCSRLALCADALPPATLAVAHSALANLIGGITFFHGEQAVLPAGLKDSDLMRAEPLALPPRGLFTAVPSRSFFPRGFLWVSTRAGGGAE